MDNNQNNNKNGILIIVLLAVVAILVLFFPKIYGFVNSFSMPKVEKIEVKEETKEEEISEDILEIVHFPLMRTSIYNKDTYYLLDKFTIKNLSNNDILLNAFLDVYEGNMTSYEGVGACTNISKQFNKDYMELRIKNIVSNKLEYKLENFYVPEDLDTKYTGTWNYDSYNNRFVYVGLCSSKATNTKYYNLEQQIKMEKNKSNLDIYYYVGFAKVEGNNYVIYKDAKMTEEIKK